MAELLVIADDFTGGLDTGVQFAQRGLRTCVFTGTGGLPAGMDAEWQVLVAVLETRHGTPDAAYAAVRDCAAKAKAAGIPRVYKKTDSALRGNIGAELAAVRDALGSPVLPFLPALPGMNRITRGGVHYIDGVPAAESVFGRDPFAPVTESDVARLIGRQSGVPVLRCGPGEALPEGEGILVCDSASDSDLAGLAEALRTRGLLNACAGCAGFAAALAALLAPKGERRGPLPPMEDGLFVLCGSLNPITLRQMDRAEKEGFVRVRLRAREKLEEDHFLTPEGKKTLEAWKERRREAPWFILDASGADGEGRAFAAGLDAEETRRRIGAALGEAMKALLQVRPGALLITGGDTLLACMRRMGVDRMEPLGQIFPGVVLAEIEADGAKRQVIAKSGGFGPETLLCDLRRLIGQEGRRR